MWAGRLGLARGLTDRQQRDLIYVDKRILIPTHARYKRKEKKRKAYIDV